MLAVVSSVFSVTLLITLAHAIEYLQGYRVISGLVVRDWCLREVCSNSEIIRLVTDPTVETTKLGKKLILFQIRVMHYDSFSICIFFGFWQLDKITGCLESNLMLCLSRT
jgi:hypothetical protein